MSFKLNRRDETAFGKSDRSKINRQFFYSEQGKSIWRHIEEGNKPKQSDIVYHKTASNVLLPCLFLVEDNHGLNAQNVDHHMLALLSSIIFRWSQLSSGLFATHHPVPVLSPPYMCHQELSHGEHIKWPKHRRWWLLHIPFQEAKNEKWENDEPPLAYTANVGWVDLAQLIGTSNNWDDGNCRIHRTEEKTQYDELIGRAAGKLLKNRHTKTAKRVLVPGAQEYLSLGTSSSKLSAVAVAGPHRRQSMEQGAGNLFQWS